jgi:thiol-disulfide isomerase/thioredoxin
MKNQFLFLFILLTGIKVQGQSTELLTNPTDPFCLMINTIYKKDALSFESKLKLKNVFETDTIISFAKVMVKKSGNRIEMLQIIPDEGEKELLFSNDTSWLVDHQAENIEFLGTTIESLNRNSISSFFPFSIYNLDTIVSTIEPFWKISYMNDEITIINLEIANQSPDVSDVIVFFISNNSSHLLSGTYQEYTYMNIDKGCESLSISDYLFPDPALLKLPEYYTIYAKDMGVITHGKSNQDSLTGNDHQEIILDTLELFDLKGKTFKVPEEGLTLFDFWYVGCAPCVKSAPVIEKLYSIYKDEMYFLSVNEVDKDTAKITSFKEKTGISFPVLLGGKDKLSEKISGSGGYPVFFLLDNKSRKVLWSRTGFSDDLESCITEAINKYL